LLDISESANLIPAGPVKSYQEFLQDPLGWQLQRGMTIPADSAEKAIEAGYSMRELGREEAIERGSPSGKLGEGVVYWAEENGK